MLISRSIRRYKNLFSQHQILLNAPNVDDISVKKHKIF